ncbi:class II fumarate hydratase [Leucothrix arctica]|uniref:class II fumarate hydratase n=1 Tax=Leucothrix arctica TaxID=1481894 RepID=UPI001BA57D61|nr:class II fumarate hydratase [Leucothrix arctica]
MSRIEIDSFGQIEVGASRYWGAQTQRSLQNFPIGNEPMPRPIIQTFGLVKAAAAKTNMALGVLDSTIGGVIVQAANEVFVGELDDHFPLVVWQTGSGTQTNMNANEVIANRAIELLGGDLGSKKPVHPNDHVNLGQSSNDTFPTVMHVAFTLKLHQELLPSLAAFAETLQFKAEQWSAIIKIGRTHAQDATPLTLGHEFSGYAEQINASIRRITQSASELLMIAQGGTAVGTGLNTSVGFAEMVAQQIADDSGYPFESATNKFALLAAHDGVLAVHGSIHVTAMACYKIANDIRLLASGPRAGLGELALPQNEPGSSIMPGKVNPTQCEALTQVCAHIHGNNAAIAFAASQGQFELNVYKPMIAYNVLQSIQLLTEAVASFNQRCVIGIEPRLTNISANLQQSLMLVTALVPKIGYDQAAELAKQAHKNDTSLREEAVKSGVLSAEEYDKWVRPELMLGPL